MLWHDAELPQALSVKACAHREAFISALAQAQLPPVNALLMQAGETFKSPVFLIPSETDFWRQLNYVFSCSEFISNSCCKTPKILVDLILSGELFSAFSDDYFVTLKKITNNILTNDVLDVFLRETRNKVMVRIIWRDFTRAATMVETTGELSNFADAAIQLTMNWHYEKLVEMWGEPVGSETGQVQSMAVLAMGKLGAKELNVSSDIDLIFTYDEAGETSAATNKLNNQEFFVRLGQRIIKSLNTTTENGFVFRVDMRLRPHGQSGELVHNFNALETYYQSYGRDWERYAMVKARVIAQSDNCMHGVAVRKLTSLISAFTYRKYIDFSVMESLRSMKGLINRQVQRKGMDADVKLGTGGIREIEFIVQMFQLIRGGNDVRLQVRSVCVLLPFLEKEKYLPSGVGDKLLKAYVFLRNVEHGIQGFQDRQTQTLPTDDFNCLRLSWLMNFKHWSDFLIQLDEHRALVNHEFQLAISFADTANVTFSDGLEAWELFWDAPSISNLLFACGSEEKEGVVEQLTTLKNSREIRLMQKESQKRLNIFMPRLLSLLFEVKKGDFTETLKRIVPFIEAIVRRSVYLVLLVENPVALKQLVVLCAASPWIADQLRHHPILLDELLTPEKLYAPPSLLELQDELRREVLRLPWSDVEGHMEALRYFRAAHALRVAASEVTKSLAIMKVSDYLSGIAEAILQHVLALAWEHMVERYGYPRMESGQSERLPNFIVVAYGKLGGFELGHGSDLDLVFIHAADAACSTDGNKEIDNVTFYTRLGQRIVHILTANMLLGPLYEVDMRLRPSGNSGMLVTSFVAYEKYQFNSAWVWEQQALVRARVVAGNTDLTQKFHSVRKQVLMRKRNLAALRSEVVSMRDKMQNHLGASRKPTNAFDLKQGRGGIVDIEFVVQYAVLAWSHNTPLLAEYTDNIRILEVLSQTGHLSEGVATQLMNIYQTYRSAVHGLVLQNNKSPVVFTEHNYTQARACVDAIWQQLLQA